MPGCVGKKKTNNRHLYYAALNRSGVALGVVHEFSPLAHSLGTIAPLGPQTLITERNQRWQTAFTAWHSV